MMMLCNRREHSRQWETNLCPNIHKKLREIAEERCILRVDHSNEDHSEVVEQNNDSVSLLSRMCSCHRWQVYGISCKHACIVIMQIDAIGHRYVDGNITVESYWLAYAEAIFPVQDNDQPINESRKLLL